MTRCTLRSTPFPYTTLFRSDLDETIRRLQAYEAAGADVLYAPGLTSLDAIRTVCAAVSKPVNVVAGLVGRSEEHTSELQSQFHLVCRLLLEKKKIVARVRTG